MNYRASRQPRMTVMGQDVGIFSKSCPLRPDEQTSLKNDFRKCRWRRLIVRDILHGRAMRCTGHVPACMVQAGMCRWP